MKIRTKTAVVNVFLGIIGYIIGRNLEAVWNFSRPECHLAPGSNNMSNISHEPRSIQPELIKTSDELIMIGVMTSWANLDTRAAAIFNTWGRDVTGRILFYVGQAGNASDNDDHNITEVVSGTEPINIIQGLPVVVLNDVTDAVYPPRRKSFAMLRHMEHNFGRHFRWFVRADDDAYIRYDFLSKILRSLNDSTLWYLGCHSDGLRKERRNLGLLNKGAYCMGGPGVIFSSLSLRLLVPHLPHCHDTAVTSHEDTELGRCVQRHLGISCPRVAKAYLYFRHTYNEKEFKSPLKKHITSSATLHSLPKPKIVWNIHFEFKWLQIKELQLREENLKDGIREMDRLLRGWEDDVSAGTPPTSPGQFSGQENNHRTATRNSSGLWDREREAAHAERRGRAEAVWGHVTVDNEDYALPGIRTFSWMAQKAADYIPSEDMEQFDDEVTVYQRYSANDGLQHTVLASGEEGFQLFRLTSPPGKLEWRELSQHKMVNTDSSPSKNLLSSPQKSFAQRMTPLFTGSSTKQPHKDTSLFLNGRKRNYWPGLHILVPLSARYQSYVQFVNNLSKAAREYAGDVLLHVALFKDTSSEHTHISKFSKTTSLLNISVVELPGAFSRGVALNALATDQEKDSILVFIDVDMIFTGQFLYRVALNVKPNTAYSPVVFSKFSPETECYGQAQCTPQPFNFSQDSGLWRVFGYGMMCIRTEDFFKCGRMNGKIVGWGKEDVDFLARCKQRGVEIFRAADTGLTHVYHHKTCDPRLASDQRRMCRGSRFSVYGSEAKLSQMMMDIEKKKKTSP